MNQLTMRSESASNIDRKSVTGLIYLSEARVPFSPSSLERLALDAEVFNQNHGISGYLMFYEGRFIQYIEGEASETLCLMQKIRKDERHQVVQEISFKPENQRIFPDWSMRYIPQELVDQFAFDLILERIIKMYRLASGDSLEITQNLLREHLKSVELIKKDLSF